MIEDKKILDACCSSKMMWFEKNHPEVLYVDKRKGSFKSSNGFLNEVNPDMEIDFTDMPFPDNSFHLVVFDPPHRTDLGHNSWMANQYGKLLPSWETDLRAGFDECMRVLKPNGTLIFKWNEKQIKTRKILDLITHKPLFGHNTTKHTIWMTFMKL